MAGRPLRTLAAIALLQLAAGAATAGSSQPTPRPADPLATGRRTASDPAAEPASDSPTAARALADGNALARAGRPAEAAAAYLRGWDPRHPDPVLAYNLGLAAQQQGELPAAILWYRRALRLAPDDAWAADNLAAARRALGLPSPPTPTLAARAATHRGALLGLAIAVAWTALGLLLLPHPRRRAALAATAAGALLFGAWLGLDRFGPRPAVLLADCGALLAGSEPWVRPAGAGWRLAHRGGGECPSAAVAPIAPR